jgi:hypothetical protein
MLLVSSSFLTHYCAARSDGSKLGWSRKPAEYLSITFRRVAKIIATLNTIVIFLACTLQFTNSFDRCFCNSSVFSLRHHAFNAISLAGEEIAGIKAAWGIGVALAAGSVTFYLSVISLWVD